MPVARALQAPVLVHRMSASGRKRTIESPSNEPARRSEFILFIKLPPALFANSISGFMLNIPAFTTIAQQ